MTEPLPDLASETLQILCPMHVRVGPDNRIQSLGNTLRKVFCPVNIEGEDFFAHFEVVHPQSCVTVDELSKNKGRTLSLRIAQGTTLKGVAVPNGNAGVIVDLSFGIHIIAAVRDYGLTGADFSPTDQTINMLYLVEAQGAAMTASRGLNVKLHGAVVEAEERAYTDPLTGLRNRRAVDMVLSRMIALNAPFSLLHLDLDFFKQVNDRFGHAAGDRVLQEVARILVEETRAEDTIARVGGDEFVLLFDKLVDRDRLTEIAMRLIAKLERPIAFEGQMCRISASLGITRSPDYANPTAEQLLSDADQALYVSKRSGRARHSFFRADTSQGRTIPQSLSCEAVRQGQSKS